MGHHRTQFRAKADLPVGFPYRFNSSLKHAIGTKEFTFNFIQILLLRCRMVLAKISKQCTLFSGFSKIQKKKNLLIRRYKRAVFIAKRPWSFLFVFYFVFMFLFDFLFVCLFGFFFLGGGGALVPHFSESRGHIKHPFVHPSVCLSIRLSQL